MAKRGNKALPDFMHVVNGTHRKDRHGDKDEIETPSESDPSIEPPKKLKKREQEYWDKYIASAKWLTLHDAVTADVWVKLAVEFEDDPANMVTARIAQLRAAGNELGMNHITSNRNKKVEAPKDDLDEL
jgi:hypothetical protein